MLISLKYFCLSNLYRLHQVISIPKADDKETNGEQTEEEEEEGEEDETEGNIWQMSSKLSAE
jgi:hypothetical protein